jgi:hypothetical protein
MPIKSMITDAQYFVKNIFNYSQELCVVAAVVAAVKDEIRWT